MHRSHEGHEERFRRHDGLDTPRRARISRWHFASKVDSLLVFDFDIDLFPFSVRLRYFDKGQHGLVPLRLIALPGFVLE